jgi:hypothetical protein
MCQAIKFSSYDGILLIRLISSECDINFLSLVSFSNILQDQLFLQFLFDKIILIQTVSTEKFILEK